MAMERNKGDKFMRNIGEVSEKYWGNMAKRNIRKICMFKQKLNVA